MLAREEPVPWEELQQLEEQTWICHITQHAHRGGAEETQPSPAQQMSAGAELSLADEFSFSELAALNTPKYLDLNARPSKGMCENRLNWKERESLNALIEHLLHGGCVHEASRVCRYFHFCSQDVALVLHCRALASTEAGMEDLHSDI